MSYQTHSVLTISYLQACSGKKPHLFHNMTTTTRANTFQIRDFYCHIAYSIPPTMTLSCPKVQLTEIFLPPILFSVSDYSHTLRGENMTGETRQKILDAAEKLLLLKGLARVTTKEIARETGLSEGALYRHFDHKEEIFFALMARHLPVLCVVF